MASLLPVPAPGARLVVAASPSLVLLARVRPVRHAPALWSVELATAPAAYPYWRALASPVGGYGSTRVTVGARTRGAARAAALSLATSAAPLVARGLALRSAVAVLSPPHR